MVTEHFSDVRLDVDIRVRSFFDGGTVDLPRMAIDDDHYRVESVAFRQFDNEVRADAFPWAVGNFEWLQKPLGFCREDLGSLTHVTGVDVFVYEFGH